MRENQPEANNRSIHDKKSGRLDSLAEPSGFSEAAAVRDRYSHAQGFEPMHANERPLPAMKMSVPGRHLQMKCEECEENDARNVKGEQDTGFVQMKSASEGTGTGKQKDSLAGQFIEVVQQDANGMIQRAVQEDDVSSGVQQFSTNCGWIDWPHADPANSVDIINEVRNARPGHVFTARWGGHLHSAEMEVEILTDMTTATEEIRNGVSLGIFQDLSNLFESSQLDVEVISGLLPFFGYRSSFSVEDLPSNLIGFYSALHNYSHEDVCDRCHCWAMQSSLDRFHHDSGRGALEPYNLEFRPPEYYRGGSWPADFASVQPLQRVPNGTHWRINSLNIQNTFTALSEAQDPLR